MTEEELEAIYRIASKHNQQTRLTSEDIRPGHYYSHGRLGEELIVRMIIDESRSDDVEKDMVIYKIIKGAGQGATACVTRQSFAKWAKFEVTSEGTVWKVKEKNEE